MKDTGSTKFPKDLTVSVSIIVASYNSSKFIEQSLYSAINQTLIDIEIIVVDDCSTDDSLKIIHKIASSDNRIIVLELIKNMGPAGARNKAMEIARGEWIAILDSDDFMLPKRLEILLNEARAHEADIIADDLIVFHNNEGIQEQSFLNKYHDKPFWLSTVQFISSNIPSYGYLKPVIRRELFSQHHIKYDTSLRNSEDYFLILKLLLKGAKYFIVPFPGYHYRKHADSISFRRNIQQLNSMREANNEVLKSVSPDNICVINAINNTNKSINHECDFLFFIDALKSYNVIKIGYIAIKNPTVILYLYKSLKEKIERLQQNK
ncbi:MAG: glycosyltransferase [Gammaproteobacteria bacterium]|nr:glycosyltransferase [Gammaproteobacteria bacterium]